jgi:SAM-dependent methyltransferase
VDFSAFDERGYQTLSVTEGYRQWLPTYEATVLDLMDIRLLARIQTVAWRQPARVLDLACGTGRIGVWLRRNGARRVDGVDVTAEMLSVAREKRVYESLLLADVQRLPVAARAYPLTVMSLADEHLVDLAPLYREVSRASGPAAQFVLVGYHPYFLMAGIPTHFDRAGREPAAIESHVHLFSDHVRAATAAGWSLQEMDEGLIDGEWLSQKPKWRQYLHRPVSFVLVWRKTDGTSLRPDAHHVQ